MSKQRVQRKLTTIMVADVVGYSHWMHVNEEATLRALEERRSAIDALIRRHEGRIFKTGGDSVLAEFASAVEAVRCAVGIQEKSAGQSTDSKTLQFRIGINLGDVMIRGDDLFGDGVNVAARLEAKADPGGICISANVFEQVRNKVQCEFEDLGPLSLRNIAEPVPAYRVAKRGTPTSTTRPKRMRAVSLTTVVTVIAGLMALSGVLVWQMRDRGTEPALTDRMALPLPDTPSIAVLPFTALGTDVRLELFGDGITRDIITDLSGFADLMVIASTSTFTFKDKPTDTRHVAEELGVRFVLDGSIQGSGENMRVNIRLVDALSGEQLWAERYDRRTGDIFAVQDEITQNVVAVLGSMEGAIALADRARTRAKHETNLTAYEYALLARDARNQWTKEGNDTSLELAQKATALDPQYARAHVELAWTYFQDATRYRSMPAKQSTQNAMDNALRAIELDQTFAEGYWVAGDIYAWLLKQPEKALISYDRALALNPNHADILASWGGWILPTVLNRPDEGIDVVKKAMRLSPFHEEWYYWGLMNAYFMAGQFDQAVLTYQSIKHPSTGFQMRAAASYAYLGRMEQARKIAGEILGDNPGFSTNGYLDKSRAYQAYRDAVQEGLLLAGLPE